jgi:osmotically-inducible protein OsmY
MKTNEDLQLDVENAIKWEPLMVAAEIGVTAKDGVITLTASVDSYLKKLTAENAAKKVSGVKVVVEKIEVKIGMQWQKDDNDIAEEILYAFKWNWEVPSEGLKVKVEKGWVTLHGELGRNYQRESAIQMVRNLTGVTGLSNNIRIKSEKDTIEKKDIEAALKRNWYFNDQDIEISVTGNNVKLTGRVSSYYAKDEAEQIAWNAPGVATVDNEIIIVNDYAD